MTRTISNATAALIRRLLWDVRRPLLAGVASRRATQIAGSGATKLEDLCVVMCVSRCLVAEPSRWKSSCWSWEVVMPVDVACRHSLRPGIRDAEMQQAAP